MDATLPCRIRARVGPTRHGLPLLEPCPPLPPCENIRKTYETDSLTCRTRCRPMCILVREDLTCRVLRRPMCIQCQDLCQYGALHVGSYVGLCVSYVRSFVKRHTHVGSYVGPMSVLCRHVSKDPTISIISNKSLPQYNSQ